MRTFEEIMNSARDVAGAEDRGPVWGDDDAGSMDISPSAESVNSVEKLPKPVYYIESPDDDTVLVGIDVTINRDRVGVEGISEISWYDTAHERVMLASATEQKDDYFAFKRIDREGGGYYYFAPMNLEIYDEKVKQRLLSTGGDFASEEEMLRALIATMEDE